MPDLWITFVMLLIVGTISYNFAVIFPLLVEKGLHRGDGIFTLVYSAFSAGGLLGALLVARRATVSIRTVSIGAALLGVSTTPIGGPILGVIADAIGPRAPVLIGAVAALAAAAFGVIAARRWVGFWPDRTTP